MLSEGGSVGHGWVEIDVIVRDLARFRYALRKFLRFSEGKARRWRVTPRQHQLILGVVGCCSPGSATVFELAEFLQDRVHSVGGLVEREQVNGLVPCTKSRDDHRVVVVSLTRPGETILSRLSRIHRDELKRTFSTYTRSRSYSLMTGDEGWTGRYLTI
jgi:DNA-binding MarR family transcriptional regulator